ncbi:hypothetical protein J3Q64DRAFT_1860461 [Phycomyces blakesleeanus]
MTTVLKNVGLFNESNHNWTIPEWSKIPMKYILKSQRFNVGNHEWIINLYKGISDKPEHLGIFLIPTGVYPTSDKGDSTDKVRVCLSIIKSGIKTMDTDNVEEKIANGRGYDQFITLQDVQNYLTDDQLTLSINLTINQTHKNSLRGPRSYPKPQPLKFYAEDLENFQDVIIHVFKDENNESDKNESNLNHGSTDSINKNENKKVEDTEGTISNEKTTLHGHKFILATASPWFRDIFLSGMKESTDNEVKIHGVDPKIFKLIFDFSYGNDIYIKDSIHGISILKVADRLQFKRIKKYAFSCLRAQIKNSNIFDIWEASDLYDCDKTRKLCEKYMRSNYADIFVSPEWLATSDVYALKAINIDGLKGRMDETVFYKAVLSRREAATQEVINLRKAKEKELEDNMLKAQLGNPTPSGDNESEVVKGLDEGAKDPREGAKDSEADDKNSEDASREDTGEKGKEDSKNNGNEKMDTNVKATDNGWEDLPENVKPVVETEEEKLERLENIRWEEYIKEELEAIQKHFETMIRYIRFPQMDIEFLADIVEKEDAVMQLPGIKDILIESYRHKAFLGKREVSKKYQSRTIESS